jgi:hypothetical protein
MAFHDEKMARLPESFPVFAKGEEVVETKLEAPMHNEFKAGLPKKVRRLRYIKAVVRFGFHTI